MKTAQQMQSKVYLWQINETDVIKNQRQIKDIILSVIGAKTNILAKGF